MRHTAGATHNNRSNLDYVKNSHIDRTVSSENVYMTCFKDKSITFEQAERRFYENVFSQGVLAQNQRNNKRGQKQRNKSVSDLLRNKKTAPDEFIFQIGNMEAQESWDLEMRKKMKKILLRAALETYRDCRNGSSGFYLIDVALHMDEGVAHLHMRGTYCAKDKYGYWVPCQKRALEASGYLRPDLSQPISRYNNSKVTFTNYMRDVFLEKTRQLIEQYDIELKIQNIRHPVLPQKNLVMREYKRIINSESDEKMIEKCEVERLER